MARSAALFFSSSLLSSLELGDTQAYEPYIRTHLGLIGGDHSRLTPAFLSTYKWLRKTSFRGFVGPLLKDNPDYFAQVYLNSISGGWTYELGGPDTEAEQVHSTAIPSLHISILSDI